MKKTLLILCACLFGALGGVKADTVDDLTAVGWTEVTSTEALSSGANNSVYVLVDAGASTYFVTRGSNLADRPKYVSLVNPFANPGAVWTLESRGTNKYAMQNIASHYYLNSSANGYDDFMDPSWTKSGIFDFAYSSRWDITNSSVVIGQWSPGQYMGPWDGGLSVTHEQNVACNKDNNNAPGFKIYSISRSNYAKKYLQQAPNLAAPVDVTFLIVNPNIYQGGSNTDMPTGWSQYDVDSQMRTEGTGDTKLKGWDDSLWKTLKLDYFQTIVNLPGGKYYMTAATRDSENHGKLKVYIYHNDSGRRSESDAANSTESDHTTEFLDLDGGSTVNIGIRTDGNSENSTVTGDNFRMSIDPYLSTMATELPDNGAMTAGLWYHFTVANTGNYILTATNLSNIIYATGLETALSAAGSTSFTAVQELTAGTDYYVRSSSDNNLTKKPCISAVATELPADGAMTAGNWFYFDIATAGHYDVVATSLANIVYTTDGDAAQDASIGNHFTVKNNDLTVTRYYVKSSSAQKLQWYLTDEQDYRSRMSDELNDWTGVGAQTAKAYYNLNDEKGVETYNGNATAFGEGDVLYQTISNLPNGNYRISLYAWENYANHEEHDIPTGNGIAQVFANDAAQGIEVIKNTGGRAWDAKNTYTLNCHVTDGTLKYGVKNIATGGNWAVCRHISLTYTGPYNEIVENTETKTQTYEGTFTEDVDFTPTAECPIVDITDASFTGTLTANFTSNENGSIIATAAQKEALGSVKNVIVNGTCDNLVLTDGTDFVAPGEFNATSANYFRAGIKLSKDRYATVYLPYAFSTDGLKVMEYTSYEDGVLTFTPVDVTEPSTPYLVRIADDGEEDVVEDYGFSGSGPVSATDASTDEFKGTYNAQTLYANADGYNYYGFSAKNGDFRQASATGNTCGAFRAYVKLPEATNARVAVRFDDGTTGIATLDADGNISGVDTQKDGKFLENGKIVIMKNGVKYDANGKKLN